MNRSVGQSLKAAREAKHLTIEQVSRATFIKARFLQALEDDRLEEMHTAVQARGFLRMYAELLELEADSLLDIWDGKTTDDLPAPGEDGLTGPLSGGENAAIPDQPAADEETASPPLEEQDGDHASSETPEEIFRSIGAVLKSRREDLRISYEDVEKFVHIRSKYLQALEEGRLDDLPSTVQGRGMLSNYAHFLEVDNSYLQLRFAEGLQRRRLEASQALPAAENRKTLIRPAKPTRPAHPQDGAPRKPPFLKSFVTPDLLIAVPLIIFLLGFSFWALFEVLSSRNGPEELQAPDISSVLLEETAVLPTLPAGEGTLEPTSALAQEATLQASTQGAVEEVAATESPASGGMLLNINIVARQSAWLKVTVGKSVVFNGRVVPGNAYPFSGNERIEFITGNAAALQVFYNGIDLGSLGLNGQVANLIFTLDGIITPTPRFSATPSVTVQPTATLQPTATRALPTVTPLIP